MQVQRVSSGFQFKIMNNNAFIREDFNRAKEIFKDFSVATPAIKDTMMDCLSRAYCQIHQKKVESQLIPQIFFLYSHCLCARGAASLLDLSLVKALKLNFDLNKLPSELNAIPDAFLQGSEVLHVYLANTPLPDLVDLILKQGNDEACNIALTLRALGYTYQKIESFKTKEYLPLFHKLYGCAQEIWKGIGTPNANWEVAKLIFKTSRFIHYLEFPDDIEGAIKTLDQIEPYLASEAGSLRSKRLKIQIHNDKAIEAKKSLQSATPEEKIKIFKYMFEQSFAAYGGCIRENFNTDLKALYLHNKTKSAINLLEAGEPIVEEDELRQWIQVLVAYIRSENYNDHRYSMCFRTAARFECLQGNWDLASKYLDTSEEIAKKFPKSCQEDFEAIEKMREQIKNRCLS